MMILGYRTADAGRFGYNFYTEDDRPVCRVREDFRRMGQSMAQITDGERQLVSAFDVESTLVPGLTRRVLERTSAPEAPLSPLEGGAEAWRIVLRDLERVEIQVDGLKVEVRHGEQSYIYALDGEVICVTRRVDGAPASGSSLTYVADVAKGADPRLIVPILTYPALKFSL